METRIADRTCARRPISGSRESPLTKHARGPHPLGCNTWRPRLAPRVGLCIGGGLSTAQAPPVKSLQTLPPIGGQPVRGGHTRTPLDRPGGGHPARRPRPYTPLWAGRGRGAYNTSRGGGGVLGERASHPDANGRRVALAADGARLEAPRAIGEQQRPLVVLGPQPLHSLEQLRLALLPHQVPLPPPLPPRLRLTEREELWGLLYYSYSESARVISD
eukprot:scaffold16421_cov113-Isochrysis_galbana.AAC.1